ncbi:MAG TPA: translation initiation factor IF-2 N-terminal domain-containing protein [Actinomycetota bacterium]|jgi:hypothetical protein|nr:translation initiation factor IF-2 N-terminal domain-containing protein [Actinomycetota bacterium]
MSKVRVFELAKELNVPAADLMTRLRRMGVSVKSHSSTVDRLVAAELTGTPLRVHEIAKELGVSAKELTTRLQGMGMDVKSHMSTVDAAELSRLTSAEPAPAAPSTVVVESPPPVAVPPVRTAPEAPEPPQETPAASVPPPAPSEPAAEAATASGEEPRPAAAARVQEIELPISIEELVSRADRLARLTTGSTTTEDRPAPVPQADAPRIDTPRAVAAPVRPAHVKGPGPLARARTATRSLQERIEAAPGGRLLLSLFCVAVVAAVLISNLPASYSGDLAKRRTGRVLVNAQLYQGWNMFAPDPPTFNIRLVAVVRYSDGTRSTWSPPVYNRFTGGYRDFRWRRSDSISPQDSIYYNGLADWLARRQHKEDGRNATEVIFYQATAASPPPGSSAKPTWQLVRVLSVHPVLDT